MGEPAPPRNPDQDVPKRSGEEMGNREPLAPQPQPEREERRPPLFEEETYERGHEEKRPSEENPPLED
jgi:hypothetical protein